MWHMLVFVPGILLTGIAMGSGNILLAIATGLLTIVGTVFIAAISE